MDNYKYKVCIRCYTYNQAEYISDALDSFVMQSTNFEYIIVVVDDASTDGEQIVIERFVNKEFILQEERQTDLTNILVARHKSNRNCFISAVLLKENLYAKPSIKSKIVDEWRCQSQYEALCEGDDWWLANDKLQKQVDVLDSYAYVCMCACGTIAYLNGKETFRMAPSTVDRILSAGETILGGGAYLGTNSLMYRISLRNDDYKFHLYCPFDYFLQIHGALYDGIYYLADCMSAYRVSANGSWVDNMKRNKDNFFYHKLRILSALIILDKETSQKYHNEIMRKITQSLIPLFHYSFYSNDMRCTLSKMSFISRLKFGTEILFKLLLVKTKWHQK